MRMNPSLSVAIGAIIYGTYWYPIRYLNQLANHSSPLFSLAFLMPLIITLPILFTNERKKKLNIDGYALLAIISLSISPVFYFESMLRINVTKALLLFYLLPVWSTLAEIIILKRRVSRKGLLAVALSMVGIFILTIKDTNILSNFSTADLFPVISGIAWGLSSTFFNLSKSRPSINTQTTLFCIFTALINLTVGIFLADKLMHIPAGFSMKTLLWMGLLGIGWFYTSSVLILFGISKIPPVRLAILLMFEVLVGVITATIFANEAFSTREFLALIAILSAIFIDSVEFKKKA